MPETGSARKAESQDGQHWEGLKDSLGVQIPGEYRSYREGSARSTRKTKPDS